MVSFYFDKEAKIIWWRTENTYSEKSKSITLHKTQIQVDEIPQQKSSYPEPDKEKVRLCLECVGTEGNFLNRTNVAQTLKMIINKWNIKRWKSIYKAKETIKRIKEKPTEKENIFSNPTSYRELISKLLQEPNNLDIKKTK